MITVSRRIYIEDATPSDIFAALADPNQIGTLLPRFEKVELHDYNPQERTARMVTYMSMGGIFGTIRCEGNLTWVEPSEILFKVRTPLPVETRWRLTPAVNGTEIAASMSIDLAPMLGPVAGFVPVKMVSDILGGELDSALKAISENRAGKKLLDRAVAA